MRRLRNTEARRIARLDPLRRQQEQARNTEARQRVCQKEDKKNRQGILQHVDKFVNKILKAGKKNKQGILQCVDELGWRILKEGERSKLEIQQQEEEFVRRIHNTVHKSSR